MARDTEKNTEKHTDEHADQQEGVTQKVVGKVRRAASALGRAARSARGLPEAGTDALFQKLHADHEEASQLFEKLKAQPEGSRAESLWKELSTKLLVHLRAEQQTVYEPLSRWDETKEQVEHAEKEHGQIERQLLQLNGLVPGTGPFLDSLVELEQTVRHHVDDEEGKLLPGAREALSDAQLETLVTRFEARKLELKPSVGDELSQSPQKKKARDPESETTEIAPLRGKTPKSARTLEERSYEQLMMLARRRAVPGRSKMNKKQLLAALENEATDPG